MGSRSWKWSLSLGFSAAIVGAMVAVQIFALRIYTLAATKLVATAGGREAMNQIRDQIRGGKIVYVGNLFHCPQVPSFQYITNAPQQGNALIIYPTTNLTCVLGLLSGHQHHDQPPDPV